MPWTVEEAADLTLETWESYAKGKWTDISHNTQKYWVKEIFDEHKITVSSGDQIRVELFTENDDNFRWVRLGDVDSVGIDDSMKAGFVPWRHCTTAKGIARQEIAINRSPSQINSLVKIRRAQMWGNWAKKLDDAWWTKPVDSTDEVTLFGIFYWLKYNATEGFNGGAVTGFTGGPAGISPTTYPNWKNWTFNYTDVSYVDLAKKIRSAIDHVYFESPLPADLQGGRPNGMPVRSNFGLFMPYTVKQGLEDTVVGQRDNPGYEVAFVDGKAKIRGLDLNWVVPLDTATGAPVIGINWDHFKIECLEGFDVVETPELRAPNQHNVMVTFVDATLNTVCDDRRSCFLGATADPYP